MNAALKDYVYGEEVPFETVAAIVSRVDLEFYHTADGSRVSPSTMEARVKGYHESKNVSFRIRENTLYIFHGWNEKPESYNVFQPFDLLSASREKSPAR